MNLVVAPTSCNNMNSVTKSWGGEWLGWIPNTLRPNSNMLQNKSFSDIIIASLANQIKNSEQTILWIDLPYNLQ